jgi:Zn-dependent protease with chaperone function
MLAADYFDGRSSRRHAATLAIGDGQVLVTGDFGQYRWPLAEVDISHSGGGGPCTLRFPDDALCELADDAALAAELAAAGVAGSVVIRAERRWRWALGALAGAVVLIAVTYVHGLPWLAERLAPAIPAAVTEAISRAALQGLDSQVLTPSKLTPHRQQEIATKVAALATSAGSLPPYRLQFRSAPQIGANAFALPGGDVIVLDELLTLAKRDEEVIAVVAHELGHLHFHHGMRQLIQSTVVSVAAAVYLGDVSTLIAGLTALVLESRYSRQFEREADAYAGRLLLGTPASVEPLIAMLRRLDDARNRTQGAVTGGAGQGSELLSSHPDTTERIRALQDMARR